MQNDWNWDCPECGNKNTRSGIKCSCGYEAKTSSSNINDSFEQKELGIRAQKKWEKLFRWTIYIFSGIVSLYGFVFALFDFFALFDSSFTGTSSPLTVFIYFVGSISIIICMIVSIRKRQHKKGS